MIGIYCRISKDGEDKRSIEVQKDAGISFAESKGLPYKVYIDRGIGGNKSRSQRKGFADLLDDVESGLITAIYLYNQDRLARDEMTWFSTSDIIKKYNVDFYEDGNLVNLDDSSEFLMRGMKAMFDADEWRKTSNRFKKVLKHNAEKGRVFSFIQFGFMEGEDKKLVINEDEAKWVRRVYQWSLDGLGTQKIAEKLNKEKVPTSYNKKAKEIEQKLNDPTLASLYKGKKGKFTIKKDNRDAEIKDMSKVKWSAGTIYGILKNPIYKGERRWGRDVYQVPNIIEPWFWDKVNENLKNNSNNRGHKVEKHYLLKGILRCGVCGRNYYGRQREPKPNKDGKLLKPKDNYYMCSSKRRGVDSCGNTSISIEVLDSLVWFYLFYNDRMKEILKGHFSNSEVRNQMRLIESSIKELTNKVESIDHKKDNVYLALSEGVGKLEDARRTLDNLTEEKRKVERELSELEISQGNLLASQKSLTNDVKILDEVSDLKSEDRRSLIRKFIKTITILNTHYSQFPVSPYPKFTLEGQPNFVKKALNKNFCFIEVEFNVFGLKKEYFVLSRDRKTILNYPSNDTEMETNKIYSFESWQEFISKRLEIDS